jgi:hypothetical protein
MRYPVYLCNSACRFHSLRIPDTDVLQYKVQYIFYGTYHVISTARFIHLHVGFDVLTAVVMKGYIFWNVSPFK